MSTILTVEELRAFLNVSQTTQDKFADYEKGYPTEFLKNRLNHRITLTKNDQINFIKRIIELVKPELSKEVNNLNFDGADFFEKYESLLKQMREDYKKEFDSSSDNFIEKFENWLIKNKQFDFMTILQRVRWQYLKYETILYFIRNAPIDLLSNYWDNFKDIYSQIGTEESKFLLHALMLSSRIGKNDCRPELLEYMQTFSSNIGKTQEALNAMHFIFNREQIFSKNEVNYKKSKRFHCKDDPKVVEAYRTELERKCEKLFFESKDSEIGDIIYSQSASTIEDGGEEHWIPGFITRMDELHWNLLIAYLLVRADDENGEKLALIQEKLDALEKENRN